MFKTACTYPNTGDVKGNPKKEQQEEEKKLNVLVWCLAVWNNHDSSVKQKERNKIEALISRFSKLQTRLTLIPEKISRSA